MDDELDGILEEFFTEADESLDELEQDLIKLETMSESGTEDSALVDRIFRVLHTLKGGAGFLGLEVMAKLAHAGENLLDEVRGGKVNVNKSVMDALLQTNDLLKELMEISKEKGDPSSVNIIEIVGTLENLAYGDAAAEAVNAPTEDTSAIAEEVTPVEEVAPVEEDPTEEPVVTEEPVAEVGQSGGFAINEELLAEIAADDRLAGAIDDEEEPAAETPVVEEPTAEAEQPGGFAINEELLAEIAADDRLAGSIDDEEPSIEVSDKETPVIEDPMTEEPVVEKPIEPEVVVNQDLLDEIADDDLLCESIDDVDDVEDIDAELVEPEKVVTKQAEVDKPVASQESAVLKRGQAKPDERRSSDRRQGAPERRKKPRRSVEAADATIRVETGKIDQMMNLVGELVLARNSLVTHLSNSEVQKNLQSLSSYSHIVTNMEHLSRVTKDMQMSVLSTRMQPIKKVFDKIPRQVRELKNQLSKEVDLIITGEMTEVDKSLVEELADPMVHLIRNSMDHGIETPAEREAVGKSATGSLSVNAYYEGSKVVIAISDDGKGIDPEIIKQVAIDKGLIDEATADRMADKDAIKLVMAAGFSTAREVSDVSGRGVGMDVVNSHIQKIKGTVDIESEVGVGTTVYIYLPLTLAIVQALLVQVEHEGFAIPIGDISEVIKFNKAEIHKVNDQDVIEIRGEVLPLFYLKTLTKDLPPIAAFGIEEEDVKDVDEGSKYIEARRKESQGYVVVVREGSHSIGVVTDYLLGQEEAVVKQITSMFKYNSAISGATITGDGTVHMILDVPYLLKENSKNGF